MKQTPPKIPSEVCANCGHHITNHALDKGIERKECMGGDCYCEKFEEEE